MSCGKIIILSDENGNKYVVVGKPMTEINVKCIDIEEKKIRSTTEIPRLIEKLRKRKYNATWIF